MKISKNAAYRKKIVKSLYYNDTLSSAELAKILARSSSLTTGILADLIKEEIVIESGLAASSGGRRATNYALKPNVSFSVAVAMDQFVTQIAIMDLHNNIIGKIEVFELTLNKNANALEIVTERIQDKIKQSKLELKKFLGIGITMPGFVDTKKGVNYTYLSSPEESLVDYVSKKTSLPVVIDNDSSAIALAELRFGVGRSYENVMVVNIGWGIGLGIIIKKELFRGDSGFAGEFSHIPLFTSNRLCVCGKTGCLETEAAISIIVEKARESLAEGKASRLRELLPKDSHIETDCDIIFKAALQGDGLAIDLISEAGFSIGKGLAVLIHILNPGLIVLSGRGARVGKILESPVWNALHKYTIPRLAADTEIKISDLGDRAELIGAAVLVIENYDKY